MFKFSKTQPRPVAKNATPRLWVRIELTTPTELTTRSQQRPSWLSWQSVALDSWGREFDSHRRPWSCIFRNWSRLSLRKFTHSQKYPYRLSSLVIECKLPILFLECPVVFFPCQTILRMDRTMAVSDRYFKAYILCILCMVYNNIAYYVWYILHTNLFAVTRRYWVLFILVKLCTVKLLFNFSEILGVILAPAWMNLKMLTKKTL